MQAVAALSNEVELTAIQKARLTTWIIDRHRQGEELPLLSRELVLRAHGDDFDLPALSAHERADRLLLSVADEEDIVLAATTRDYVTAAFTESEYPEGPADIDTLFDILWYSDYVERERALIELTEEGRRRIRELEAQGLEWVRKLMSEVRDAGFARG